MALSLLYVLLALGLNIVVGYAGLLDLGYVAFYAVGAYTFALLASPHFDIHLPFWLILPLGAAFAALAGIMLGFPVLRLRGDYLAIVTLGFGEIVRIFMLNLNYPVNITNGPQGINMIDPINLFGWDLSRNIRITDGRNGHQFEGGGATIDRGSSTLTLNRPAFEADDAGRDALVAAGHDMEALSANLVNAFLRQAIAEGFFHADKHQGNLFVKADGTIAAEGSEKGPRPDSLIAATR